MTVYGVTGALPPAGVGHFTQERIAAKP